MTIIQPELYSSFTQTIVNILFSFFMKEGANMPRAQISHNVGLL